MYLTLTLAEFRASINATVTAFLDSPEGDPGAVGDILREIADEVFEDTSVPPSVPPLT